MTNNKNDFKRKNFDIDNPIEGREEDILGRTQFAEDISLNLLNWKSGKNIIIGINGEWGSGKSSVINLIRQYINDKTKTDDKPIMIDFNPWILSKREDITKYFFNEIASAFDYKDRNEKDKITAERFRNYANLLGFLEYVSNPCISLPVKVFKDILKTKSEKYDKNLRIYP